MSEQFLNMVEAPEVPPSSTSDYLLTEYQLQQQGRLVSVAMPLQRVEAAHFLDYAQGRARFLWRDGRTGVTFAGMGIAADLMAWGETRFTGIERQAQELFENAALLQPMDRMALPRLFGGFAFRKDFVPDFAWQGFHPAHFILPHYQLVYCDDQGWLTINALLPPDEDPEEARPQLHEALAHCQQELAEYSGSTASPVQKEQPAISYPMPYDAWSAMIEAAQEEFANDRLQKVVLARVCEARQSNYIDLDGALGYLQKQYPECYTFLFEPRPHHAFFGATPELLAGTRGHTLSTMGLAGSIQRGATPEEDAALADELLHSEKDLHEHDLVVDSLRRRLEPLVDELTMPDAPQIYTLSNIQHLYTPVQAQLKAASGILPVLEALHPTPALGGTPRETAMEFIREAEGVPRGWYAGPVGWIDPSLDGAFGVAIRSAVAQDERVWMYAGAGIVAASEPQKEWTETGWKFRPIQSALGIAS